MPAGVSDQDRLHVRRLLLVVDSPRGGLGAVTARHAAWFDSRGWNVEIAGPTPDPGSDPGHVVRHAVPVPEPVRNIPRLAAAVRALRGVVRNGDFDVVHCHGPRSFLVARLAGVRRPALTIHGTGAVPSDPAGYDRVRRAGLRAMPRLASVAVAASPEFPPPWRFLAHASPHLATLAATPVPQDGPPTFLWLARVDEGRPAHQFVEAVARTAAQHPVRGVVAGTGPDVDACSRLARDLDAPVEFVGHADPAPLLASCTALVLLSRHEAVNFAVQEAMWSGRAVVASPLPGLRWLGRDAIRHVTGVEETTDALIALCDRAEATTAGERAGRRIRDAIDPDDPWPAVEAAYRSLLATGGSA